MTSQMYAWVSTWTELRVPESETVFMINAGYPPDESRKKWVDAICPLTEAPGWSRSVWARIIEHPDVVVMLTTWLNRESLESFRQSSGYERYWRGLSTFGEPTEREIECTGSFISSLYKRKRLSTLRIVFPNPMDQEQREQVEEINGLIPRVNAGRVNVEGMGARGSYNGLPVGLHPAPLWIRGTKGKDGKPAEMLLWFHFWKNRDMEERWKKHGQRNTIIDGFLTDPIPQERFFQEKIRALGALEWTEEHYGEFHIVPNRFNGEAAVGKFLRNGRLPPHIFGSQ